MSELLSIKAATRCLKRRGRKIHLGAIYRKIWSGQLPALRCRGVLYVRRVDLERAFAPLSRA